MVLMVCCLAPLEAARKPRPDFSRHYRVIELAYRSNRWSLLNDIAAPGYRFVGIDGTPKTIAELERGGKTFARQGGRITQARLHIDRVTVRGSGRVVTLHVALDVFVPRPGRPPQHMLQENGVVDSWRNMRQRWQLTRSVVFSEAITQFGATPAVLRRSTLSRATSRGIAAHYRTIDRAWRDNRWELLRPFATADARFIEIDGEVRTLDQMDAGGRSFKNAGGVVVAARVHFVHLAGDRARAIATAVLTAAGSYPAGARRLRFAQRDDEQDVWRRVRGQWLFSEGRTLRQTITTYSP